jgi:hypothetical protein
MDRCLLTPGTLAQIQKAADTHEPIPVQPIA